MTAYIAMGSNLGDRRATLESALAMLEKRGLEKRGLSTFRPVREKLTVPFSPVRRVSDFIETAPVGGPAGQGNYLNAAVELETDLAPDQLLAVLMEIEKALGRDRSRETRWGPRTCDLDILLIGDLVIDTPTLTVPHPRMHERRFVLEPLAQIALDAVHPTLQKTIRELLQELDR